MTRRQIWRWTFTVNRVLAFGFNPWSSVRSRGEVSILEPILYLLSLIRDSLSPRVRSYLYSCIIGLASLNGWSLLSLCFRDSVWYVLMQCVSSTDAEEMDKMLFADSPQDGEEATVEEGSCWASDIGWSSIWICIINWRRWRFRFRCRRFLRKIRIFRIWLRRVELEHGLKLFSYSSSTEL